MKKIINIIFAIGNLVWLPFVCWKVYTWFAPEVGFELPELSFVNIFALRLILGVFNNNLAVLFKMYRLEEKEDSGIKGLENFHVFLTFSVILLINYLIKLLIF